ncbi:uncharacterized protein LOC142224722 [Haematobia irritans]|uniref:uncharacterized protein LOC142224722 n=1 Tax=Haematobia irritans TaxID=7368 RepID=UPI003F4F91A9
MGKWDKLKEYTKIPKQKILQILQFCLNDNNYFKQDDTFYHQTYGMPMGNPLSPTIANIVLDNLLDEVILELNSKNIKIKLITKYVDDLLAIINKDDEQEIMKLLNSYHTKIQFTIEKEKNGEIPYLDMKMIKDGSSIITDWYTKTTASGRMINYHSTQPKTMKINTASNFIQKVIVPFIPKLTECKTWLRSIEEETTTIAYKSNDTLQRLFTTKTNRTDKMQLDNVVYELTCNGNERETCNMHYVGTTRRQLKIRMAEHEADINKHRESTALAQHIKESGHSIDFKAVKILDRERNENKRYTLESLRIQQRIETSMNTKEDKDNTNLQYSIAII